MTILSLLGTGCIASVNASGGGGATAGGGATTATATAAADATSDDRAADAGVGLARYQALVLVPSTSR